ncbi:Gfo/Idh/MocA family oxidoreductase [Puniceicoccaceae bacterium K14]|nr:Gfo/Idh/MocA family oxidoreductase [Puniceicoccaceae bacterium K14]
MGTYSKVITRRSFIRKTAIGGAVFSSATRGIANAVDRRRRYVIVGTGSRCRIFQNAIEQHYREDAVLVGLCDANPGRLHRAAAKSVALGLDAPETALPDGFEKLLKRTRATHVIVTTVDSTHDEYIVRSLESGCDVVTEKPMTTTASKVMRIQEAVTRTGGNVRVTFNYRYMPARSQVKELLMAGKIGDVLSVNFQWLLNTHHGADYFRRWHGEKKYSGGLMVHKATHHFDLVNWWLGANPVSVFAVGKREFYTPAMAKRLGLKRYHERCLTCPEASSCSFRLDLKARPRLKSLYLDHEHHDGYHRDRCVFHPRIDIEDTMNVIVNYDTKATLNYTLNAFNSWEGYRIAFNGTKGRLEHANEENIYVSGTDDVQGATKRSGLKLRLIPLRGAAIDIEAREGEGGHGGGDRAMLDELFLAEPRHDPLGRASDARGGAASVLVGAAANECIRTGMPVQLDDLAPGWNRPEHLPMPNRSYPLTMP